MSIEVRWDSPGSPATGYVLYYQPERGAVRSVNVTGGDTESYLLEGLQKGMTYQISIVALSEHLPSAVVGPVTASMLESLITWLCIVYTHMSKSHRAMFR